MTKLLFQSLAVAVAVLVICGGGSIDGGGGALAFVPSSPSLPSKQQMPTTPTNAVLRMAGIHEPSASLKADENFIKRELLFRQVVKEVNMVSEYLDWLVATSSPSSSVVEGSDAAAGNVEAATTTTSGDDNAVELLGGSGGRDSMGPSIIATGDKPPDKPSTQYKPALRTNLGSTILLSGSDILDSTLLSILNNNFFGIEDVPNFHFNAIRAIVPNVGAAKKMAIGREARYGGLLDKLVIEPLSETAAELPSPTQLEGASGWIVQLTSSTVHLLPQIATLAKNAAMLKHLIVMIVARDVDGCSKCKIGWESILESSNDGTNFAATLLAMDEIYVAQGDTMQRETGYYHIDPIIFDDGSSTSSSSTTTSSSTTVTTTTTPPTPVRRMSARNAYRILGHALALDCTVQKALSVYEYNPTEVECLTTPMAVGEFALRDEVTGNEIPDVYGDVKMNGRMIQAMREVGFTPVMELDVLVDKGIEVSYIYIFVLHVSPPPHFFLGFTTCTYCKRRCCHGKGSDGKDGGRRKKEIYFHSQYFFNSSSHPLYLTQLYTSYRHTRSTLPTHPTRRMLLVLPTPAVVAVLSHVPKQHATNRMKRLWPNLRNRVPHDVPRRMPRRQSNV